MKIRLLIFIGLLACGSQQEQKTEIINGLCLVAPPFEVKAEYYQPILDVSANWVAIIPYAFCNPSQPEVIFDHPNQWVGERTEGITQAITLAHEAGLKVMLKPHQWVKGQGWAGDLSFDSEEGLQQWMKSYGNYILHYARVGQEQGVEMISIGTEVRQIANSHPEFWIELIESVRKVYSGKLTYSANWDNYEKIEFWDELDIIGIDAYFPSSKSKTPTEEELLLKNDSIKKNLEIFSNSHLKKVLFTEYGFKSIDYTAAGHWKSNDKDHKVNLEGQANAYNAFYKSYWNEDWFAGAFAWKWHYKHSTAGGDSHSEFSPQNKISENILRNRYSIQSTN